MRAIRAKNSTALLLPKALCSTISSCGPAVWKLNFWRSPAHEPPASSPARMATVRPERDLPYCGGALPGILCPRLAPGPDDWGKHGPEYQWHGLQADGRSL